MAGSGRGRSQGRGPSRRYPSSMNKTKPMLNLGRLDYFKWDLNEIMDRSGMDPEKINSFKANLEARARQRSIREAKDYIHEVEARGDLSRDIGDRLCRLLDRYTRVR